MPRLPNSKGDGREGSREYSSSSFSGVYACVVVFFCFFFVLAATPWLGMNDQGNHAPPHVVGGT